MALLKAIGMLLLLLLGSLALLILLVPIIGKLYDRWALLAARRYCEENGLEYIEVKAFPNHYGLYFRKDGKRLYASYDFERNRTITWKKGSPLDIAEKKLKT